jgi:ribosome-associated protein
MGNSADSLALVKICCRALDEKKAEDLRVLDVSEQSSITDYLVLATGTSDPHLRALRVELEKAIDASAHRIVGMETAQESGWIVVDVFDVMIHIFTRENRAKYALEKLWKDATEVSLAKLMQAPKVSPARPKARKVAKKSPVKKAKKNPKKGR